MPNKDQELLLRISRREKGAFEEFYDQHFNFLYGLAFSYVRDHWLAEEALQDCYKSFVSQLFKGREISNPLPYLVKSLRNRVSSIIQKKQRTEFQRPEALSDELASDGKYAPDSQILKTEEWGDLLRALDLISPDQREVIMLHHVNEMTFEEISEKSSEPLGTVLSRYRLGMQKLKTICGKYHER